MPDEIKVDGYKINDTFDKDLAKLHEEYSYCGDLKEVIDKFEKGLTDYNCENEDEEFFRNLDLYIARALLNTFGSTICKRVGAILSIMTEDAK